MHLAHAPWGALGSIAFPLECAGRRVDFAWPIRYVRIAWVNQQGRSIMTDAERPQVRASGRERSDTREGYESPKITVIGPLEKITLGSAGGKTDKAGGFKAG